MNRLSSKHRTLFIVCTLLLATSTINAQAPELMIVEVDRAVLSTDESLILTVTINTAESIPSHPALPPLDDFALLSHTSSTHVAIVNGTPSIRLVYQYRLKPIRSGDLLIGPISLTIEGQTHTSDPIAIQATPGVLATPNSPLAPNTLGEPQNRRTRPPIFVEAEVDTLTPFVGQQVLYTFRLYQMGRPSHHARYIAPSFNTFWIEEQDAANQYSVRLDNELYHVAEVKTVLFPTIADIVTIDPAQALIKGRLLDPNVNLATDSITLKVQSLPPNPPAGFAGAVGQFTIQADVDLTDTTVNEPITLRLTLTGHGNLNTLPEPVWPDLPGWRVFDSQAMTQPQFEADRLGGSRIYERVLIPDTAGTLSIPAITFTYFDPQTAGYQTITSDPIAVTVAPGPNTSLPPPPVILGGQKIPIELVGTDIRHVKPIPVTLRPAGPPVTTQPWYWLTWGLPPLTLMGYWGWQRRRAYQQANADRIRSSRAYKKAIVALTNLGDQPDALYTTGHQILATYLAEKLNRPITGLTQTALAQYLAQHHIPRPLSERLNQCLLTLETGRFAPELRQQSRPDRLLREIGQIIDELEAVF